MLLITCCGAALLQHNDVKIAIVGISRRVLYREVGSDATEEQPRDRPTAKLQLQIRSEEWAHAVLEDLRFIHLHAEGFMKLCAPGFKCQSTGLVCLAEER